MNRQKVTNVGGSFLSSVVLWAVLVWQGAPSWAAFGTAYVGYLVWRLGDKVRDGRDA